MLIGATAGLALGSLAGSLSGCTTPTANPVACHTVIDCTGSSTPVCDAQSLTCRACNAKQASDDIACRNGHPETPRCGPSGACVGCMVTADCTDKIRKPACSNFACGPCQQSSDCESLICSADGSCAQLTEVLFVNNRNGSCQGTGHQGTTDDPYCTIQDAVDAASGGSKALISVAASSRPYDRVKINQAGSASGLYITGASTEPGAVVVQGTATEPALYVASAVGKNVTVTVRNVEFVGTSSASSVVCELAASLTLISSRIHDSGLYGLSSNSCTLNLDATRVYSTNIGLLVAGGTYAISNVMVWRNSTTGIAFAGGATGSLRFATVYANGNPANDRPAGIDCGAGQNAVDYSIVFDNIGRTAGGSSFTDLQLNGCVLNQVVTNDSRASGGISKSTIEFVSATDGSAAQGRQRGGPGLLH